MQVPGYEIQEEIARGGMGIVYRARQLEPQRTVALKMLLPHLTGSVEMAERFRLEVRALTELEHSAILPVYQVGEHDGLPFFTMKLATGGTLAERRARFAGQWENIATLIATLADAVQFAHEHGVLHRDLKPGNVLFDDAGRSYVSDFGLAKLTDGESNLTRSLDFLGTAHYVAPEVAASSARHATTASDIYSLGAILYELLAGRPPFEAEGVPALLRKIAEAEPLKPSTVRRRLDEVARSGSPPQAKLASVGSGTTKLPRDLEVICLKCLAKDPAARYGTARELAEDLRRFLSGRTILARPATRLERVRSWTRRNPALAATLALLTVVLAGATILQSVANRRLKRALVESLLTQARLQRSSGRAGQRFDTIALLGRATEYRPGVGDARSRSMLAGFRTELAGALALPDVRPLSRWSVQVAHLENECDFTADLKQYAAPLLGGGFAVFSTESHKPIWQSGGAKDNPVVQLRLSPDGRWIAARFQNGDTTLQALDSPTTRRVWPGESEFHADFAFNALSNKFAIAPAPLGAPARVDIVNLKDGTARTLALSSSPPGALVFDRAGTRLATASDKLTVWRLDDGTQIWSTPLSHRASALAWSPEGHRIAVALDRRLGHGSEALKGDLIMIFNAVAGVQESVVAELGARIERLAFHPDGQSVAAATWGGELVWASVQPAGFRLTTEAMQRALTFSSEGRRLAYSPSRDELGLLEVVPPAVIREWTMTSAPAREIFGLAVSADGRWVATGTDRDVRLWDARLGREAASLKLPASPWWLTVLFGPNDESLYYSAFSFGVRRVELVRTKTPEGDVQMRFGHEQLVGEPTGFIVNGYAADRRSLIVGQNRRRSQNDRIPPTMWLWPDGDPARARKLVEDFPLITWREAPGGQWAITIDLITPDLWIWNAQTTQRVRNLGISLPVRSEFSSNGRWLITGTRDQFALWEVGTWRKLSQWPARPDEQASASMVVSPDSQMIATRVPDGRIILRELPAGTELVTLAPPRATQVADWQFSRDSKRLFLLLKSGHVREWNLAELRNELGRRGLDWSDAPRTSR